MYHGPTVFSILHDSDLIHAKYDEAIVTFPFKRYLDLRAVE